MARLTPLFFGSALILSAGATPLRAQYCTATAPPGQQPVGPWQRWEQTLISTKDYVGSDGKGNPYRDLLLRVTFTNCSSGATLRTYGFWYGLEKSGNALVENRKAFRIRAALPVGTWQWETSCTKSSAAATTVLNCADSSETGLAQKGLLQVAGTGTNALYRQGLLDRSDNGRFLTYGRTATGAEGVPFFWLGDAAWNASILAPLDVWKTYVNDRASNTSSARPNTAFTVVQLAVSPKVAGPVDTSGNPPFESPDPACQPDTTKPPNKCTRWNARYWAGLDDKIQYANQKGLVVLLAGLMEPLQKESDAPSYDAAELVESPGMETLARNVAARYYGNFVIFSPGFDHKIPGNLPIIGKVAQVAGDNAFSRNLVTNHPAGGSLLSELIQLQNKSWLDFQMFQSGTPGSSPSDELRNATERARTLPLGLLSEAKPLINGEAIYDGVVGANSGNHTPYRTRQTAWLSFLSGAMGYSAGTCGVFDWGKGLGGCPSNVPLSTMSGLTAQSMRHLRFILQSVYWPRLRPEHGRIKSQASTADQMMVLAYDGSLAIVAYLPAEQNSILIDFKASAGPGLQNVPGLATANSRDAFFQAGWTYRWLSPRTGNTKAVVSGNPDLEYVSPGVFRFKKPDLSSCDSGTQGPCDKNDWVLRLTKGMATPPPTGLTTSHFEVSNDTYAESDGPRIVALLVDNTTGQTLNKIETKGQGTSLLGPPQAAYEPGGNGMLVWQSDGEESTAIMGRILDSQGNAITAEIAISSGVAAPGHPTVTSLPTGHFVVAWASLDETGEGPWIKYQVFDRKGSAFAPEKTAISCEPVPGDFPRVAAMASGGFAIAWEATGGKGIHVVQLDSYSDLVGGGWVAKDSIGWPVLETLDGTGWTPTVSWGVYGFDDETPTVGENIAQVTIEQCP